MNPENSKEKQVNFTTYNFSGLLNKVITGIELDKKIFYLGKLELHKETEKKSNDLIEKQSINKVGLYNAGLCCAKLIKLNKH